MKYKIIKSDDCLDIVYFDMDAEGFIVKTKEGTITFYDEKIISSYVLEKFNEKINQLYKVIVDTINDDDNDDEGDYLLLLDDIERLKTLAELKLKKYTTIDVYKEYVSKLYYLNNAVNERLAIVNFYNNYNYNASRGGRGR